MIKAYESFEEIANDFCDGSHWTHKLSDHKMGDCLAWQRGIKEFAQWLDAVGLELAANPTHYQVLWDEIRAYKSRGLKKQRRNYDKSR